MHIPVHDHTQQLHMSTMWWTVIGKNVIFSYGNCGILGEKIHLLIFYFGRCLHNDASYEYGDFCIRLHRGVVTFTPNMFSPKTVPITVIIKQYMCDFHATIVPHAQS